MESKVTYSKFAEKQMDKVPKYIKEALFLWAATVHKIGIAEARKIKGYHDEPLLGERRGQRSIKLNRSYRAIYEQKDDKELILISVVEVNKHDY
jgi:proteic killer suppression protein